MFLRRVVLAALPSSFSVSPDGSTLATVSEDTTAVLWSVATLQPLQRFEGHTGAVYDIAFDPKHEQVATASDDGTIKVWDTQSGANLSTLSVGVKANAIAYGPTAATSWPGMARESRGRSSSTRPNSSQQLLVG